MTNHLPGVLNGFQAGKHNGRVEAMNRALQEARARARGYRRVDNFIAMAYLIAGKLTHLPSSPFARLLPIPHETTQTPSSPSSPYPPVTSCTDLVLLFVSTSAWAPKETLI
ncbi:MAG: transposase [Candidatus Accumulibacter phosphatis]|uniref:transposase n=1 Tax=Candidatus Accumulibacter sp. ACC012 TaxID=2823332 RepID=UPI0025B93DD3|nr:transposase [Candidatus Accumulibacter sp. ACC012]